MDKREGHVYSRGGVSDSYSAPGTWQTLNGVGDAALNKMTLFPALLACPGEHGLSPYAGEPKTIPRSGQHRAGVGGEETKGWNGDPHPAGWVLRAPVWRSPPSALRGLDLSVTGRASAREEFPALGQRQALF